jgi:hypothetical protein
MAELKSVFVRFFISGRKGIHFYISNVLFLKFYYKPYSRQQRAFRIVQ